MSIVGKTYLERGEPVEVLAQWRSDQGPGLGEVRVNEDVAAVLIRHKGGPRSGPRNVLIRRANGELVVRPFRGLRTPKEGRET